MIKEKCHLSQTICCRTYYSSMDNLGQKFRNQPIEVFIQSFLFLVYLILLIPLYIKRRKNENQDHPPNFKQTPKSLESLLMNFGIIMVCVLAWILLYIMNRYGFKKIRGSQSRKIFYYLLYRSEPDKLDIYPNYLWPHLVQFVFPLFYGVCVSSKILFKRSHGINF